MLSVFFIISLLLPPADAHPSRNQHEAPRETPGHYFNTPSPEGRAKSLEKRAYHHQRSMQARHLGTLIDVTGRKYSSKDGGTRHKTKYGGAIPYVIV